MGDFFKSSQIYVKKVFKEQWKKEIKFFKSKKLKKQFLGDKDDFVDEIVWVVVLFVGIVFEVYQYWKEKKLVVKEIGVVFKGNDVLQEDGFVGFNKVVVFVSLVEVQYILSRDYVRFFDDVDE